VARWKTASGSALIAALDERLEISELERADGGVSGRRPLCGYPREGKDGDGQALGCRVVRTDVDHASAQAGEARAGRSGVLLLHHSHVERLLPGTIERVQGVGDVPAQACERAAVSGGERIVAVLLHGLAHGGAPRLRSAPDFSPVVWKKAVPLA
jgi:hypothetical protein